jgi:aryl-alcohol dehydrogenase-like predicted oxidoreductase
MTQEARGVDASGTNGTVGLEGMKDRTQRRIGVGGQVGPIGLGCMSMSWGYDRGHWDEAASIAVIHRALELGVTLLDTADAYGPFTNEKLVGRAIAGKHAQAFVATKVGLVVDGALNYHRNGRPEHIHGACDASLARLAVDHIDLYQLHRVDPAVPIEDSVGAMSQLVTAGKVRAIGLSEVSVDEASRANAVHPISSIQSEMSLWTREPRDNGTLDWCAEQGALFLAYAPLGRGFLTGNIASRHDLPGDDWRRDNPRFTDQAIQANAAIVDTVRDIAAKHVATPAQVALSWLLHQGDHIIPIPGTKTLRYLEQNAGAATLPLQPEELATLNSLAPAVGSRY